MKTNADKEVQFYTQQRLRGRQLCTAAALISWQKCCISAPTISIPERQEEYLFMCRKYRDRERWKEERGREEESGEGGREGGRKERRKEGRKEGRRKERGKIP